MVFGLAAVESRTKRFQETSHINQGEFGKSTKVNKTICTFDSFQWSVVELFSQFNLRQ